MGAAAAAQGRSEIMLAGVAGLVAAARSMAAGEYISVSSQAHTEAADLTRERAELASSPAAEFCELSGINQQRGFAKSTADEVARQMKAHNALGTHPRDELSMPHLTTARPIQAALTWAATFKHAAACPYLVASVLLLGSRLSLA
ncbi:VIT1/CCC1 transporter family protein [Pacificimonas sp. ICDLI1SI03]